MLREYLRKIKPVAFIVLAASVMLMTTLSVRAEEVPTVTIDKVEYSFDVDNLTARVESYTEKNNNAYTEILIPSKISYNGKEYTVTSIANGAVSDSTFVVKVEIPSTVTEIGKYAFAGCSVLKEVNLPAGLKRINEGVFNSCNSLEEIDIPAKVEIIDDLAFYRCVKLKKVEIPDGVTELGLCAFYSCNSLEEIDIPNSVKTMEDAVFFLCTGLTRVVVPESVENIEVSTFENCYNLESIFYPSRLKEIFSYAEYEDAAQISYVINSDGTVMLTVENLPEGVTGIDLPTDIGGRKITSVTGPEGVDIEVVCSEHCRKEYSKSMSEHWYICALCKKEIKEAHAFDSSNQPCVCGYVPFSITAQPSSQELACGYKTGSLAVTVKKTFGTEAVSYQWYEGGKAISGATGVSYKISKGKKVGRYIYTCKLTSGGYSQVTKAAVVTVKAPAKGKKYKDDKNMATYKVTKARTDGKGTVEYVKPSKKKKSVVVIPATVKIGGVTYKVTSIAKNAFKGNKNIKRLTIEKNVEKIGANAFFGCKKLKTITIRTTKLKAKKVGANAFTNINSNATVKVPKKKMKAYKSMLMKKGMGSKVKFRKN